MSQGDQTYEGKLTLVLAFRGRVVARLALSALEFAEIRGMSPPRAIGEALKKEKNVSEHDRLLLVELIRAGHFQIRCENKEG